MASWQNATKARSAQLPAGTELTTDYRALTDDPEIDVLVELIGGIDNARTIGYALLEQQIAQPSTPVLGTPFWHHTQA